MRLLSAFTLLAVCFACSPGRFGYKFRHRAASASPSQER